LSQVLQEYPDMQDLQKEFLDFTKTKKDETIQMFFRLGYADDTVHSPRREIKDMII
ncbi:MAG: twin-arginine translocation pathway signal protein, partial [Arcobacter sp.]|nr:twin-arginine translocation pathway signal protein [Arcobacter sp.]